MQFHDNYFTLKITFTDFEKSRRIELLNQLEAMQHVRVGYYERSGGGWTFLIAIASNSQEKAKVAFRVLRRLVSHFRMLRVEEDDSRYLLIIKFFLFFQFDNHHLRIEPTIHSSTCLWCTKGNRRRVIRLTEMIESEEFCGTKDQSHEVEFMRDQLKDDKINDTTITIPGSIIVLAPNGISLCEFDGLIIHPM